MTMNKFSQYRESVSHLGSTALAGAGVDESISGSIGHAAAAARMLIANEPTEQRELANGLQWLASLDAEEFNRLTDPAGHHRPVYGPLALHLHLAAFRRWYEQLDLEVWSACEDVLPAAVRHLRLAEAWADAAAPAHEVSMTLWRALGILGAAELVGREADIELVDSIVHANLAYVLDEQAPGCLHEQNSRESLDAWTYRELYGLHALARLALARRNDRWSRCVERIAMFHMENTQPDNTTTQPWGLFAFAWSPQAQPFADQQMHDASTYAVGHGRISLVAGLLFADAADSFASFS